MGVPLIQQVRIGAYIAKQGLMRKKQFPLVLMLEPLFQCNLACQGCGKIDYPPETLKKRLGVEECIGAALECGAPVVSIPGGEPLIHPEIGEIVRGLVRLKKFVYLCTNALLLKRKMGLFEPSPYLTFSVHLDGLKKRHDKLVSCDGVFDSAVEAIGLAKKRGFRVTTNTTIYGNESIDEAIALFDFITGLGVEGMTLSPAFHYGNAREQKDFLGREDAVLIFRRLLAEGAKRGWKFNHSSLFLNFLAGNEEYRCSPWGNPTRNIFGWQMPCYLINEGYAASYKELMEETDWDSYGYDRNAKCADCMVHCGYEPTAVMDTVKHPLKALLVRLRGVDTRELKKPSAVHADPPPETT